MNEQTDPDVLMQAAIAAIEQQLLTETETKQPESAFPPPIGRNKLFRVSQLQASGWTEAVTRKLASEPNDTLPNSIYKCPAPMKFYLAARMKLIELRKTWIAWRTGSALRKQSAAAAVSAKEEKLQGYVDLVEIAVAKLTAEELASRAISHFNDFVADTEKHKAFVGSALEFLNRIGVNYLGHQMAAFEEHLHKSAAMAGVDAVPLDLREIYDAIGRTYPHLRDECRKAEQRPRNAGTSGQIEIKRPEVFREAPEDTIFSQEHQMTDHTAVQQSKATALPDPWITLEVTFRGSEWPALVEVSKTVNDGPGTYTAHEPRMECTMFVRRHADGRTLVGYEATENAKYLCSLTRMVTPQTTWDAIRWICLCLSDAARGGRWGLLITKFKEQYWATTASTMDSAKCAPPITNCTKEPPSMELPSQPRTFVRESRSTSPVVPSNAARSTVPGRTVRK